MDEVHFHLFPQRSKRAHQHRRVYIHGNDCSGFSREFEALGSQCRVETIWAFFQAQSNRGKKIFSKINASKVTKTCDSINDGQVNRRRLRGDGVAGAVYLGPSALGKILSEEMQWTASNWAQTLLTLIRPIDNHCSVLELELQKNYYPFEVHLFIDSLDLLYLWTRMMDLGKLKFFRAIILNVRGKIWHLLNEK